MARDVEFNVTAADRTGTALASAEAKFKASQERIRKESAKSADSFGKSLTDTIGRVSPKLAAQLEEPLLAAGRFAGPALAIGIAAATPLIGATLSAAIIGAAGAGGVVGGVLLASRDPRVKAAGTALGEHLLSGLEQSAGSFVEPVLRNIDKVEARFDAMGDRLTRIFGNASTFLDPLVDGALDAVDGVVGGLDVMIAKAGPVMDTLGDVVGEVGTALGEMFAVIAGGSDGAALALRFIGSVLVDLIHSTAVGIRLLTELFEAAGPALAVADKLGLIDLKAGKAGDTAAAATPKFHGLGDALLGAGQDAVQAGLNMQTFGDRMADAAGKGRGLYDSTTSVGEAMDRASEAAKKNGKTLDENTTKGRANRQALSGLAASLVANYQAYVNLNGEGAAASRVAASNRAAFVRLAGQFGLSRNAASALATQMGLIPTKKTTQFYANTHDAEGRIAALNSKISAVKGKTVSVNVVVNESRLRSVENRLNRLHGGAYAAGGSWAAADVNSGMSRTGGPSPVNVTADVTSNLYLDGSLVYATTARQIRAAREQDAWRRKAGPR